MIIFITVDGRLGRLFDRKRWGNLWTVDPIELKLKTDYKDRERKDVHVQQTTKQIEMQKLGPRHAANELPETS